MVESQKREITDMEAQSRKIGEKYDKKILNSEKGIRKFKKEIRMLLDSSDISSRVRIVENEMRNLKLLMRSREESVTNQLKDLEKEYQGIFFCLVETFFHFLRISTSCISRLVPSLFRHFQVRKLVLI